MSLYRTTSFALLWAVFCSFKVFASTSAPNYFAQHWQVGDNGLPENNVTAVVQTQDGYIWLGTRNGLVRFDGVHFTVFNSGNTPAMQSNHVTSLLEAKDGTLWIGHDNGEITCLRGGKFFDIPMPANQQRVKIVAIIQDGNDIWILNAKGELTRLRDGWWIPWQSEPSVHFLGVSKNPRGGFWVLRDRDISLVQNGQVTQLPNTNSYYIQGISASRDGGLWVMMESKICKWKDNRWMTNEVINPAAYAPNPMALEDRDGNLLLATADEGLFIGSPNGFQQFNRASGFSSDWINALCQDHEGNLWVGTGNGGLVMLRIVNLKTWMPPDQWQGRTIQGVAAGAGQSLWVGTEGAGLYRFQNGTWTNFDQASGLAHRYIWSVAPDTKSGTWAGSWGSGAYVWNGTNFSHPGVISSFYVATIKESSFGGILIGTTKGLIRYDHDEMQWLAREPQFISPDVRALVEAPDGSIWFGMSGGGLGFIQNGKIRQYRRADGLSNDFVQCLHVNADGSLWAGTVGGGLNYFEHGHFVSLTTEQGLPSNVICDIEDDGLGNFWMSSDNGLIRISQAELKKYAEGKIHKVTPLVFGLSDGLPALECSGGFQPAGTRTADGHLWFPTAKGLVQVEPANIRKNLLPPPVTIEQINVDDHALTTDHQAVLQIVPGRHRVEFFFTALSFAAPEKVRFKYRLDGLDHDWVDADSKRIANYSYLPPGKYAFHVTACNNDGVWNENGATLSFTMLPFFWQTWWFRIFIWLGTSFAVICAVLYFMRQRVRLKLERMKREQAVERERTRIARDLHDDLGASLTRISMLSQDHDVQDMEVAQHLQQIFLTARESTRAMSDIVWAVNPSHDSLESLAAYLQKFSQNFLRDASIRCRLDMPLELPAWGLTASVRHNILLAFKEALNNVVKHARASEVRISLNLQKKAFNLGLDDNGIGFVMDQNGFSGNGLKNMARRLEEIGGHCKLDSVPGRGTKVEFFLPADNSIKIHFPPNRLPAANH